MAAFTSSAKIGPACCSSPPARAKRLFATLSVFCAPGRTITYSARNALSDIAKNFPAFAAWLVSMMSRVGVAPRPNVAPLRPPRFLAVEAREFLDPTFVSISAKELIMGASRDAREQRDAIA
jgi:hypothetical protein